MSARRELTVHAILKHAPVLPQNSLKMQLLYELSAALLQKSMVSLINFYFVAELHAREPYS